MRKPKDLDAELQALLDKTQSLKERRLRQLGELVAATGADALDVETLTGALLAMVEADDQPRRESWRKRGAAFFQRRPRNPASEPDRSQPSAPAGDGGATSP